MKIKVTDLRIYPIKSCGSISLSQAEVTKSGLLGDRRYMLVNDNCDFVTGRSYPALARVKLAREQDRLIAQVDDLPPLELLESLDDKSDSQRTHLSVRVWGDTVRTIEYEAGSRWFSQYLDSPVRLVYLPETLNRSIAAEKGGKEGDQVGLADAYPLHLASESSLLDLNEKLDVPIAMSRFRPNIIITGAPPFDEDCWSKMAIGTLQFDAPKLCDRCVFTTIDPITAHKGKEPLKTLASYRRWQRSVWFGTNLIARSLGNISVGDDVHSIATQPHPAQRES